MLRFYNVRKISFLSSLLKYGLESLGCKYYVNPVFHKDTFKHTVFSFLNFLKMCHWPPAGLIVSLLARRDSRTSYTIGEKNQVGFYAVVGGGNYEGYPHCVPVGNTVMECYM